MGGSLVRSLVLLQTCECEAEDPITALQHCISLFILFFDVCVCFLFAYDPCLLFACCACRFLFCRCHGKLALARACVIWRVMASVPAVPPSPLLPFFCPRGNFVECSV